MEEKLEKLEHHFKIYKDDMIDVKETLKDIKVSLLGSDLNNKKGIIYLIDDIDKRVKLLENKQILADEKASNMKWFERGVIGIIFAYIIYLLTHKTS